MLPPRFLHQLQQSRASGDDPELQWVCRSYLCGTCSLLGLLGLRLKRLLHRHH
ncbi:hypothetical protein [Chitinilyticum piscinae]|uniref:hypothetical protein n=1 Tax=Chitinilyticum piscinae TaxID=2866724 RepID=UPI00187E293B|nr:hypothetical protein [Chitinilyticum piscinae]